MSDPITKLALEERRRLQAVRVSMEAFKIGPTMPRAKALQRRLDAWLSMRTFFRANRWLGHAVKRELRGEQARRRGRP